ncbi:hypothetical protein BT67DRAFT_365102, partial [Trichocladium antarcticum]
VRPLLLLVALVNLAWSLYQLPATRVLEGRLCRDHYAAHDPSALRPDGTVPEERCKLDGIQQRLGRIQGAMETLWVAGVVDFLATIPLVVVAEHRGHRFVLCLNLVPRAALLAWTFAVGYFDRALPVNAILAAPALSLLGGDCVFNSIVYALVSELTDDHVLRATLFGYVNAISSIFSLQLGPALASATMTALLWLPLWIGTGLLLLAIPVIVSLPSPSCADDDEHDPLIPRPLPPAKPTLQSATAARFRAVRAILTSPSRNLALLLTTLFLAALASTDTKLLPLYISKRYAWRLASVGYLLAVKALLNFLLLALLLPTLLRWRRPPATPLRSDADADADAETAGDQTSLAGAHASLALSVLGALAIALAPTVAALVPALLLYALGIALPVFTYSLLRSPRVMATGGAGAGTGTRLFAVAMLVRAVGALLGAVLMPALWVAGLRVGGWALGVPFLASAGCYAVAAAVVRRIA